MIKSILDNIQRAIEKLRGDVQQLTDGLINSNKLLQSVSHECSVLESNCQEQNASLEKLKLEHEISQQDFGTLRQLIEDLHYISFDGSLLWRITDVTKIQDEARSGRQTFIDSPLFYSSPTGYKMRARLYIYGDDNARNTHMSICLLLLKGDYDAIVHWPFLFPVTFCLRDQTSTGNNHIDSFYPDPISDRCERPYLDINIVGGISKFYPLTIIEQAGNCFIRDDTMFIHIEVIFDDIPKLCLPDTKDTDLGLPLHIRDAKRAQIIDQQTQVRTRLVEEIRRNDRGILESGLLPHYPRNPAGARQRPSNSESVLCEDLLDDQ